MDSMTREEIDLIVDALQACGIPTADSPGMHNARLAKARALRELSATEG